MSEFTSFLPVYAESLEQNTEYLRQSLPLMMQNNVPADPINYAIWYDYVAGTNTNLVKAVDALIRDRKPFDTTTTLNLYKTYICNASVESFEKINGRLQKLINQTTSAVDTTNEKASEASDNFNIKLAALRIRDRENNTNLQSILSEIIVETKQLVDASKALKNQLDDTRMEMELLRNELTNVREVAKTDALTGLLNRRAFDRALSALVENPTCKNACLAILDIDHFKRINDSFGHLIGDKVIRYFALLLKKHVAEHHYVARYGGEEMAIIMPDTTLSEAINLTEQIRIFLESSQLKRKDNTESIGKVTVSAGIAIFQIGDTSDSILDRADKALYRAKETGRNKVVAENALKE
ncbi:MAG: GGDEF domain-containing protein [Methylobacter sp.]